MLFSVVDDRSGVCYQEYRCVYREEVETALRFLFNAMAPKPDPDFLFQDRPKFLYLDNGLVAKSRVFQQVKEPKSKQPVVLFIDEAHDLHPTTLIGLKRLMDSVGSGGDSYDNALAEAIIGLYKTEVIHRQGFGGA